MFTGNCYGCGQTGHLKSWCPLNAQQPASGGGGTVNHLVGQANEVDICINGTDTRALLDTGSMVSTIGKLKLQAKALNDLIRIEGAGGHNIRYSGYVEAEIKFADLPVESACALFLVVPDTV